MLHISAVTQKRGETPLCVPISYRTHRLQNVTDMPKLPTQFSIQINQCISLNYGSLMRSN